MAVKLVPLYDSRQCCVCVADLFLIPYFAHHLNLKSSVKPMWPRLNVTLFCPFIALGKKLHLNFNTGSLNTFFIHRSFFCLLSVSVSPSLPIKGLPASSRSSQCWHADGGWRAWDRWAVCLPAIAHRCVTLMDKKHTITRMKTSIKDDWCYIVYIYSVIHFLLV